MKSQKSLCLFLIFIGCLFSSSHGYRNFFVGGKGGWVLHPKEQYNHWAGRQRFQINDTLIFKYEKGSDSVLLVHKDDYFNCNMQNPIKKMESGCSEFQFPHSGPFFFISGKEGHCQKGQKLITYVMAERNRPPFDPSPRPAQSPSRNGPVTGPALAPTSPSPVAPSSGPAALSPSPHGHASNPPQASTPTPEAAAPPSTHHSPPSGPSYSPMANPPKASSPSPFSTSPQASTPPPSHGPVEAPTSTPPAPPHATSPSDSPPSPTGTPADDSSQVAPPSKSSTTANFSGVMVLAASILFSMVAFSSFVGGF